MIELTQSWNRRIQTILNAAAEGVEQGWFVCRSQVETRDYLAFPPNFSAVLMAPRPSSDRSTTMSVSVPMSFRIRYCKLAVYDYDDHKRTLFGVVPTLT